MIQEKNDLILGLQLCEWYAQLTYYNNSMKEPVTASINGEEESYLIPITRETWEAATIEGRATEPLTEFFRNCLKPMTEISDYADMRIMVCVPKLSDVLGDHVPRALEKLGLERKYIFLQDYKSGFYYYTVNQRKELWNGDVALLECENEVMTGHVLHIDKATRPALVTVEFAASQSVNEKVRDGRTQEEWDKERDRLFFELLKKVFERRNVVTSYLLGDYFDKNWAERSFQYLCFHRHAFQGKNLFTKGACYAAMERMGLISTPDLLFMGEDIVRENIGMNLRVRGKEVYYPIVTAGVNWYEAHHVCEFIPDEEKTITIITKPMSGGQEVNHVLRLTDFPDRPNRATRLKMTVYFTSSICCTVEVEDEGFGGFFRPSGKRWKRNIYFQPAKER